MACSQHPGPTLTFFVPAAGGGDAAFLAGRKERTAETRLEPALCCGSAPLAANPSAATQALLLLCGCSTLLAGTPSACVWGGPGSRSAATPTATPMLLLLCGCCGCSAPLAATPCADSGGGSASLSAAMPSDDAWGGPATPQAATPSADARGGPASPQAATPSADARGGPASPQAATPSADAWGGPVSPQAATPSADAWGGPADGMAAGGGAGPPQASVEDVAAGRDAWLGPATLLAATPSAAALGGPATLHDLGLAGTGALLAAACLLDTGISGGISPMPGLGTLACGGCRRDAAGSLGRIRAEARSGGEEGAVAAAGGSVWAPACDSEGCSCRWAESTEAWARSCGLTSA